MNDRIFTVADLVERYHVSEHTVLRWIRSSELIAIDVSRRQGGKPRWRVTIGSLTDFELRRTASSSTPRHRRRCKQPADVIQFYK